GQGAVVAQCVDAEMSARDPRSAAAFALRPPAQGAAPRRTLHHRGGRLHAGRAGKAARHISDAERQLRAHAGAVSRGPARDAGAGAKAEKAGLSPEAPALTVPETRGVGLLADFPFEPAFCRSPPRSTTQVRDNNGCWPSGLTPSNGGVPCLVKA